MMRYHSNQNLNMISRTFSAALILNRKENLSHQNLNMISRTFGTAPILNKKTNPSLPNLATAKEVTKKTEIKRKAFSRLFDFLEHYGEKVLDKLLPEVAMKAGMNIVLRIENRSGSIIKTHPNYILCLEVSCQNDVGK